MRGIEDGVREFDEPVGDDDFFEHSPHNQFQSFYNIVIIEPFLLMELVQHILRSFDGTGDQLGIKHHIERIDTKMSFGGVLAPVYLYGITHRLESMKGEPDGQ